jgi:hypothetical protein
MAHYLILIYQDEAAWAQADPAVKARTVEAHGAFRERYAAILRDSLALQPTATATWVPAEAPHAADPEALAGYLHIEVDGPEQAMAVVADVPKPYARIELRPAKEATRTGR